MAANFLVTNKGVLDSIFELKHEEYIVRLFKQQMYHAEFLHNSVEANHVDLVQYILDGNLGWIDMDYEVPIEYVS